MNIEMIKAAAERLAGKARYTPLLSSPFLDEIAGRRVLIKAECLQHTGSFKFRGAWSALSAMQPDKRAKGVIAFSSGNHAQGVALAAREHGTTAVIIMPALKINNTKALGAEVVLYDRATEDHDEIGARLAAERGLTLVKPFDDELVIAGQGTNGLEIAAQAAELGITSAQVLVPCGGGGLTSGSAVALEAVAPEMTVHPVEPAGFDDVARSLKSGQLETNATLTGSLCDAIITPTAGNLTFPHMKRLCGAGFVVSDEECLQAMAEAFTRLKSVLEPGGAAALAAALYHGDTLQSDTVICVASGGNVDADVFIKALEHYAEGSK
ncbi:threonine ammonia-lyase [Marinosulfonomonas sp. PRT-SC04]|nr:threonine ammonia-lyase [Marinosulfonomonas sp. PRT-SC04]